MAKKQHLYNVGDIVTFKFLTGDVFTGKITEQTFKDNGTPDYKIRVDENKDRFTIYPCMTHERILKRNKTALAAMKASEKEMKKKSKKIQAEELKRALEEQKQFLNGSE